MGSMCANNRVHGLFFLSENYFISLEKVLSSYCSASVDPKVLKLP